MTQNPLLADAYLQVLNVAPRDSTTNLTRDAATAKVVRVTTARPDLVAPGCIVVKVRLRIPAEAWRPFRPETVIDVPADLVQSPVEVEVADAS